MWRSESRSQRYLAHLGAAASRLAELLCQAGAGGKLSEQTPVSPRLAACLTRIAPDLIINLAELPEPLHGREVREQNFTMIKRAFPDLQAQLEDIVAAQDKVASSTASPMG